MIKTLETKKTIDWVYLSKLVIMFALMFGIGSIPPTEPLTVMGMKVIGVFVGALFGWLFMDITWPSLFAIIMLSVIGYAPMSQLLATGMGSSTAVMVLFLMIFSGLVSTAGVSNFIAVWSITRKAVLGKPWLFSFVFLLAAYLLAATTNANAAMLICWAILYNICHQLKYKPFDKYATFMVFGIAMFCILGMGWLPFRTVTIATFGAYEKISHISVDYLSYLLVSSAVGLVSIVGYLVLGKYILKIDVESLKNVDAEGIKAMADMTLNKKQKIVIGLFAALIFFLLLPSILPEGDIKAFFGAITGVGVVFALIIIALAMRVDGEFVMDIKASAHEGIVWSSFILVSCALPLGDALTSEATGVKPFLVNTLGPILEVQGPIMFVLIIIIFAIIFTNIANNLVAGVILAPIIYTFSASVGVNPTMMIVLVVVAIHFSMLTPAACTMSAILFSNKDWITPKLIFYYGGLTMIILLLALFGVALPLSILLF